MLTGYTMVSVASSRPAAASTGADLLIDFQSVSFYGRIQGSGLMPARLWGDFMKQYVLAAAALAATAAPALAAPWSYSNIPTRSSAIHIAQNHGVMSRFAVECSGGGWKIWIGGRGSRLATETPDTEVPTRITVDGVSVSGVRFTPHMGDPDDGVQATPDGQEKAFIKLVELIASASSPISVLFRDYSFIYGHQEAAAAIAQVDATCHTPLDEIL